MRIFDKITIIGVGLIGGSIGLAVKKCALAKTVCGVGRHMSSLKNAKVRGVIDFATLDLEVGIKDADLVVVATPISSIIQYITRIARISSNAKKDLIVTDTGSKKALIVQEAERILPREINFIGGHPFSGSEKTGVDNASADLFNGTRTFLTPTKKTGKIQLDKIIRFWEALGSSVIIISPKKHDELVAQISHLPHILATALVNSTSYREIAFGSSGFSDTTRIAAGDPVMWRDICLSNSDNISRSVEKLQKNLIVLSKALKNKNVKLLMSEFEKAKRKRNIL